MNTKRSLSLLGAAALVVAGTTSVTLSNNGTFVSDGFNPTQSEYAETAILASTLEEELLSPDGEHEITVDMNEGLVLDLDSGEDIILGEDGNTAKWIDANGDVIATITIEASDGADIEFDPETGALAPENLQESTDAVLCSASQVRPTAGCGKLGKAV